MADISHSHGSCRHVALRGDLLTLTIEGALDNSDCILTTTQLVPIRGFIKGTEKFPIQKCAIFCKFKEIKELRGGVLLYAAQAIPPIDAEIAEKGHL